MARKLIRKPKKRIKKRRTWSRIINLFLGCAAALCTVYALILPAVTLERAPVCGLEEHIHDETCYAQGAPAVQNMLVCSPERLGIHRHTDSCYDSNHELICGYADFVIHTHDSSCYDADGSLICPLPETEASAEDVSLHTHTQACFDSSGNLTCGSLQVLEHVHNSSCFKQIEAETDSVLICEKEEHQHTDICYAEDTGVSSGIRTADISNGPVFTVTSWQKQTLAPGTASLRAAPLAVSRAAAQQLKDYVESNGGTLFLTLTDADNRELPTDSDGNYIATEGETYKISLGISLPNGIRQGTYEYSLPAGLTVQGGSGQFSLDGTDIGTWSVDSSGLITMVFNKSAASYTDVVISAVMGVAFSETEYPIDFDGQISVIVVKPPAEEEVTELSKWARNPDKIENADPEKIYWELELIGNSGSHIIGSTLTDTVYTQNGVTHKYTESDMAAGIRIEAYEYDEQGECISWHKWIVYPGDPNLTWTENGWSYTFPESFLCDWCGGQASAGNENWIYYIMYTSTACDTQAQGYVVYRNTVQIDGASAEGWAQRQKGDSPAGVVKDGVFQGDENGGKYLWTISATIPGRQEGQLAEYFWHLWDWMEVDDINGSDLGYITNQLNNATVTAVYNGQTYSVPKYENATADDPFCWRCSWSEDVDGNGIYCGREIDFYCRCQCTEETCPNWSDGYCADRRSNGFCKCWTPMEDITFTFQYETEAMELLEDYGGTGAVLSNYVELDQQQRDENNQWKNVRLDDKTVTLPIPSLFKKELTQDYNGYTAKYTITVNEAKLDLTGGGPLTIHDVMSDTLVYISGSLVITEEDADGEIRQLAAGEDYTITYDGSGSIVDDTTGKPVHVLDIVIQSPGAVEYTLYYDATLVIPTGAAESIRYSNSASITLLGKTISSGSGEKIYTDISATGKRYAVEIVKTAADTGSTLAGAEFGLYTETGGLICSGVTDENGKLPFSTNVTLGIILRDHVPYYVQEITAPEHYRLDTEKHWFFFCDEAESCTECSALTESGLYPGIMRLPGDSVGAIPIVNEPGSYELPATGGTGTELYTTGGLLLTASSGVLLFYSLARHRRNEKHSPRRH